jgi:hypothetical protein
MIILPPALSMGFYLSDQESLQLYYQRWGQQIQNMLSFEDKGKIPEMRKTTLRARNSQPCQKTKTSGLQLVAHKSFV